MHFMGIFFWWGRDDLKFNLFVVGEQSSKLVSRANKPTLLFKQEAQHSKYRLKKCKLKVHRFRTISSAFITC